MSFFYPWLFVLLPIPFIWQLGLVYFPRFRKFSRRLFPSLEKSPQTSIRLATFSILETMLKSNREATASLWGRQWRMVLVWLIWCLLVISLAQPLWMDKHQPLAMTGRDLMLLVDVSGSMRKMDFSQNEQPISRLDMVKQLGAQFIAERVGDRVGLILFGNKPYLRAPLSHDRQAISRLVQNSEIALAGESTAIGDAIGLAIKRMQKLSSDSRVIILLTDGANNEGLVNPSKAAQLAAIMGIKIYTIGIGGAESPAPNPYGVWSSAAAQAYEKEVLQELARITGGAFFHVLDSHGLEQAYQRLDQLEPAFTQNINQHLAQPLYPFSLGLALVISLWAVWLGWLPLLVCQTNEYRTTTGSANSLNLERTPQPKDDTE